MIGNGVVYTETIVHAAPEAFVSEAPYQLAIITLEAGGRVTGRIVGERAAIGDAVDFLELRNGVPYFQKKS
jgi:uncharacterized OB-fold protein